MQLDNAADSNSIPIQVIKQVKRRLSHKPKAEEADLDEDDAKPKYNLGVIPPRTNDPTK